MDETAFWDEYYPAREVVAAITTDALGSPDSIVEKITTQRREESALKRMGRENEPRLINLLRLRIMMKPYLDAIAPKGWVPDSQ